jgi:hypothetical protein
MKITTKYKFKSSILNNNTLYHDHVFGKDELLDVFWFHLNDNVDALGVSISKTHIEIHLDHNKKSNIYLP